MHSWVYHPFYLFITKLNEALTMSSKVSDIMYELIPYFLNSIHEMPFIILSYMVAQIAMVKSSRFVKFLENLLWLFIYAPL